MKDLIKMEKNWEKLMKIYFVKKNSHKWHCCSYEWSQDYPLSWEKEYLECRGSGFSLNLKGKKNKIYKSGGKLNKFMKKFVFEKNSHR